MRNDHHNLDHMVFWFTTTYAISAYHHKSCESESPSWWGVLDTSLSDKVCQWFEPGQWFSPATPVSFTNKTDRQRNDWNIIESGVKHHNPSLLLYAKYSLLNREKSKGMKDKSDWPSSTFHHCSSHTCSTFVPQKDVWFYFTNANPFLLKFLYIPK